MTIHELYSDSSKWAQGAYAKDATGEKVGHNSPIATSWCLLEAMYKCYPTLDEFSRIRALVYDNVPGGYLTVWQDDPKRTFKEVKAFVTKLGI